MIFRKPEEALLGFDAREMWLTGMREAGPSGGRPAPYLLRTELDDILSADTMVWPSIFKAGVTLSHGLALPRWIGANPPFWEDLGALQRAVPQDFGHPYWTIAATWHSDVGFGVEESRQGKILGPHIAATTPRRRDSAWRFLGFDITDSGISGLTNCGYHDGERESLAAEWGPHLNGFHLFEDLERAFVFRTLTDARVPEHAPFFVIGLWLIADETRR